MGTSHADKVAKKRREREKRLEDYKNQNKMKKGFTPEELKKGKMALFFLLGLVVVIAVFFLANIEKT